MDSEKGPEQAPNIVDDELMQEITDHEQGALIEQRAQDQAALEELQLEDQAKVELDDQELLAKLEKERLKLHQESDPKN